MKVFDRYIYAGCKASYNGFRRRHQRILCVIRFCNLYFHGNYGIFAVAVPVEAFYLVHNSAFWRNLTLEQSNSCVYSAARSLIMTSRKLKGASRLRDRSPSRFFPRRLAKLRGEGLYGDQFRKRASCKWSVRAVIISRYTIDKSSSTENHSLPLL